jgi:hypothetical protein
MRLVVILLAILFAFVELSGVSSASWCPEVDLRDKKIHVDTEAALSRVSTMLSKLNMGARNRLCNKLNIINILREI